MVPYDLNNRGQIVGFTLAPTAADPLAGARGFLLAAGARGPFTPIEVPGAPRNTAYGLNDAGAIVEVYENPATQPARNPLARRWWAGCPDRLWRLPLFRAPAAC